MARCETRLDVLCVVSDILDYPALSKISATLGKCLYPTYAFTNPATRIQKSESVISVVVSNMSRPKPFVALRPGIVVVTLSDVARRIASCSRTTVPDYIVLCAMLGLVQESVLRSSKYLQREDLYAFCSENFTSQHVRGWITTLMYSSSAESVTLANLSIQAWERISS